MKIIKPERLRSGDLIGVCAPASPPCDLERGLRYLERLGFRVELGKTVHGRLGYLAGSDAGRAADLNNFFADRKVKAIFTARGGYGSHRILRLLDYSLIRKNPKIFVGYSDITAIQYALLSKSGILSFSGPMVAVEMKGGLNGKVEEQFWRHLMSPAIPDPVTVKAGGNGHFRRGGVAVGRLLSGNLSIITSLVGTPYFPDIKNPILFLEEISERPYRIDRMLQQMNHAGILNKTKGVVLGDFRDCLPGRGKPSLPLHEIFRGAFMDFSFPVLSGFRYGHSNKSLSFPLGVRIRIDGRKNLIEFLENGVR